MLKLQIITGSTRPGRNNKQVADWVYEHAKQRPDLEVELVDIADYNLPLFDEPISPAYAQEYTKEHTKKFSEKIQQADAYIFVTPEYNHGPSAAIKNAIDFLYREWNNKAAGFVSYGSAGGVRAVEHLRGVMAEIQIADVRAHVAFSLFHDFENMSQFRPRDNHAESMNTLLDQVTAWGTALKTVRQ